MQRISSQEALNTAVNPNTETEPTNTEQNATPVITSTEHFNDTKATDTTPKTSSTPAQTVTATRPEDPKNTVETTEKIKQFIRKNCAPALSIINSTFLVAEGSYQSSNRAALGFTAVGAASYLRGDSTVALLSTGFAAYFTISSTCQRGLNESVNAFITTSTNLMTSACKLGLTLFHAIKNKVSSNEPASTVKLKRQ